LLWNTDLLRLPTLSYRGAILVELAVNKIKAPNRRTNKPALEQPSFRAKEPAQGTPGGFNCR
ncbi:MAG: hypothetical protein J6S75_11815, partial [Thermoguttaceae bacterium]|nr:hypothetical protein [Thermoguttaceae bacterium]